MGTLNPADLGALSAELTGYLQSEDDLDLFLAVKIGKSLAEVAKPGTLPIRVLDALRTADREGWIGRLIHSAPEKWPPGPILQRLLATVPAEHPPRTVAGDLSTYDMTEQVQLVRQALYRSGCKVVGVVVDQVGDAYLNRLYERVVGELGASRRQTWLKLDAAFKDGAKAATDVRLSVRTLTSKPLVVGVRVPRDCVAEVAPLMAALEPGSEKWARHLVVILAADPSDIPALPATIARLKSPRIKEVDVIDWVDRLVAGIAGWPFARSQRLVAAIYESATTSADCWDRLYAELENIAIGLEQDFDNTIRAIDGRNAA